jgi:hypothetical protein
VNKAYFDAHFGPFYRITQLIIEPRAHLAALNYTDPMRTMSVHQEEEEEEEEGVYTNHHNDSSSEEPPGEEEANAAMFEEEEAASRQPGGSSSRTSRQVPLVYSVSALRADVLLEAFTLYERINHLVAYHSSPQNKQQQQQQQQHEVQKATEEADEEEEEEEEDEEEEEAGSKETTTTTTGNDDDDNEKQKKPKKKRKKIKSERDDGATPVTLEDICYQPMYPDNRHCAVQSLFQVTNVDYIRWPKGLS